MSQDALAAAAAVLQKIAQGAGIAELQEAVAAVERLSRAGGSAGDFALFKQYAEEITRRTQDSAMSERALSLLIDTTHDLSSTLQVNELLQTIVTRARSLVSANLAWVTVLDDESGLFTTVTAEGYLSAKTPAMKSHNDYGAVSLIMKSKSYFSTQDYLNDTRFRHLPELDRTFQAENIVSLAGFPMLADGEVHGFLFVADRYSRRLSGREISVLGSFALHAGVAMKNANAFRLLSEALDEARRNRKALIDHIQRVEASAAAHDEMTSLLASGARLQQFLQRMANQIDGAIFLYDEELRIREEFTSQGYQGTLANELKAEKLDPAHLITASSRSRHTGRSVVMTSSRGEQCRVMALHGGTGRHESLVICHQGELDAIEIRNLERNAVALSIAKLWNEKRETEKLIASSTLLRQLILVTAPDPSTVSAVRDRLSLSAEQPVAMGLIAISGIDRAAQTAAVRECASGIDLLVDLFDDTYLAIGAEPALRAFLQKLSQSRSGWHAGGILSEPFADLSSTPGRFARMNQALQIMRRMKQLDRFLEQSQVNFFAKIFETGDPARLARYLEETLQPIDEAAPRKGDELKQTLLCYFDNQHTARRVAESLGLHINTVRQRLETLRRITGGWDDPVRALELHIALRLDEILR
ncbi:MAG: helix-turn-helix domain-containing protein [Mesorhizobium sp.]